MIQAITLIAGAIITAQGFDFKKTQIPTNSLVNLGKIDVSVYYNTPNTKPAERLSDVQPMSNSVYENDIPPLNDFYQGALPMAQIPPISPHQGAAPCPCSHMKSFGKDPSLSVLSKLFEGVSMANDAPMSPNCCEVFEIIEDDAVLPLNGNFLDKEPFQPNNLPFSPVAPPKSNSQFRPKAVEIVIIPNKKNKKSKHAKSAREDIKAVGGEKKFPKFKKTKSQGTKARSTQTIPHVEYGISDFEIVVEPKPIKESIAPSLTPSESDKNPSVKKDLNSQMSTTVASTTTDAVTTTKTSALPAEVVEG